MEKSVMTKEQVIEEVKFLKHQIWIIENQLDLSHFDRKVLEEALMNNNSPHGSLYGARHALSSFLEQIEPKKL